MRLELPSPYEELGLGKEGEARVVAGDTGSELVCATAGKLSVISVARFDSLPNTI